jgi:hypothetical protein
VVSEFSHTEERICNAFITFYEVVETPTNLFDLLLLVWLFCAANKQVQSPQLDLGQAVTLLKLLNISTLDLRI